MPATLLILLWLAMLGGCIGSFLNVVVWRVPRRKSVVYPGSACPKCGHAIRGRHNLPVLGWLMLRGKCYDCGTKIPARYPLVETLVLAMFLAVACAGPLAQQLGFSADRFESRELGGAASWVWYGLQMLLLCTLLALALIQWERDLPDDAAFPWRLFFVPWAMVLAALIWDPQLHPGTLARDGARIVNPTLVMGIDTLLIGTFAGLGVGLLAWPGLSVGPLGKRGRAYGLAGVTLIGAVLGGPAALAIAALTALVYLVCLDLSRYLKAGFEQVSWPLVLWGVTLIYVISATGSSSRRIWPSLTLLVVCTAGIWLWQRRRIATHVKRK